MRFPRPLLCLLLASAGANPGLAAEDTRPNVVLVITDDQGYGDLSCHGNPVLRTPHLDALAASSSRLTDYHVAPTCSPTRAALQTGHWTNRTGVWHTINGRSLLRDGEVTLGEVFRRAGYDTAMFGKWHLGDNAPCRAMDRGYDEVLCLGGGGVGQTPDFWDNAYFDGAYFRRGKPEPVEGFCTDVFFDAAGKFVREQARSERPFFVYLATNAPHGPMHAPPEFSAPYAEHGVELANFFGMIANIDANVGRFRALLEAEGLAENTIFVFTTDNGTAAGHTVFGAGMRGNKGSEYDGGHRVPFFAHWPAGGMDRERELGVLAAHVDVLPTLCELCGIDPPREVELDGRSLARWLRGELVESWPDRILVTDSQRIDRPEKWRRSAVMTKRWRLINGVELYDMVADPEQRHDVAGAVPAVVQRLRHFYESWWDELEPSFADEVRLHLGDPRQNPTTLTAHDWITKGGAPWNQMHVRRGLEGPNVTGHWNVRVLSAGSYVIRLRRWPVEAGAALDAGLEAGADVPGVRAWRTTPGVALPITRAWVEIAGERSEIEVRPDAPFAEFRRELAAGDTTLRARFETRDGKVCGAYYAEVELVAADSSGGSPR